MDHPDFAPFAALDLDPIKVKLMHAASGEGWTLEHATAVEREYRRFLYLMKLFPHEQTAPLMDVDTFWHYHILDTLKYAADCAQLFGHFLHHFPYIGLRGADDEVAHVAAGARMGELYEATFGETYLTSLPARREFDGAPGQTSQARARDVAFSGLVSPPTQIAFSGLVSPPTQIAFSGLVSPPTQIAFSGLVSPPTQIGTAGHTAPAEPGAQPTLSAFYSVRPTLAARH